MKRNIALGLAAVLAAGLMTIGNANAIGWPTPPIACNSANEGELYDVQHYTRWQQLQITYYCDGSAWQLWEVCDLRPGGICVAY
ncbi:MAG: hypothetical protein KA144_02450 [Xanthomonadaceae bacterium]|nr:hypothetical protein [Xanthomonadaceae bacterium]